MGILVEEFVSERKPINLKNWKSKLREKEQKFRSDYNKWVIK